jgi:hypothetical protein
MRWQIFKLTYRIPDRPRLVGIVYVFLTGAFFPFILSMGEYFTVGEANNNGSKKVLSSEPIIVNV